MDGALDTVEPRYEPVLVHDGCPPYEMRERISGLTARLLSHKDCQVEFKVEHIVQDGVYMRKLYIPKGMILVGKVHLKNCINIVASGRIDVLTEFGAKQLVAGFTGVSRAGIQKVGYTHEDTVFINVFRTDLTDIAEIEAEIAKDPVVTPASTDYEAFLAEYGLEEEKVRAIVEDMSDHIDLPVGTNKVRVGPSSIQGLGTFAVVRIAQDEVVAPARIDCRRTVVGRRTNHSAAPNCRFVVREDGDILMQANRVIEPGEEFTVNYRQAAQVNIAAGLIPLERLTCQ